MLRTHGACIISDFFTPAVAGGKEPLFTCSKTQASYIMKRDTERAEVFNGVKKMAKSAAYKTYLTGNVSKMLKKDGGPRQQLERSAANHEAMLEYHYQMDLLLENIFPPKEYEKKNPQNWLTKMQNLVGGNTYQHPHSDQGRHQEYKDERTFPFVATHGFGIYQFELWLLPMTRGQHKHGFLHKFNAESLILMRGDFVHAGGVNFEPRCHMMFYPKPKAGLVFNHEHHYWLEPDFACIIDALPEEEDGATAHIDASFLWQGMTIPFAYPIAHYEPNSTGSMRTVLTYPPHVTHDLVAMRKTAEREVTYKTVVVQRF